MNNKNKQSVNKTMQSVTSNQTCGGESRDRSQSFTESCGEDCIICDGCCESIERDSRDHDHMISDENGDMWFCVECFSNGNAADEAHRNGLLLMGEDDDEDALDAIEKLHDSADIIQRAWRCFVAKRKLKVLSNERDELHNRIYRGISFACDRDGQCPEEYEDDYYALQADSKHPEVMKAMRFLRGNVEYKQDFINLCLNENIFSRCYALSCVLPAAEENLRYQCGVVVDLPKACCDCGENEGTNFNDIDDCYYCDDCVPECDDDDTKCRAFVGALNIDAIYRRNREKKASIIQRAWRKYSLKPFKCCGTFYGECSKTCYRDDEDDFLRGSSCNANGYGPEQWVCEDCDVVAGYSVFVSSDYYSEDYIVKRIFEDYKEAEAFFEKMKLEHPNSMNIEFEGNLFDAQADFYPYDDLDNHNPIVDTFKLIDGFGPYHTESDWETIQEARLHRKKFSSCLKFLKEEPDKWEKMWDEDTRYGWISATHGLPPTFPGVIFKKEGYFFTCYLKCTPYQRDGKAPLGNRLLFAVEPPLKKVEPEESESELDEDGYPYDRCDKCGEILPRDFDWITRPNGRCYDCVPECETNDDEDDVGCDTDAECNEP